MKPEILNTSVQATSCHYIGATAAADVRTFPDANISKIINKNLINTNVELNKAENIQKATVNQIPLKGIQDIKNTTVLSGKVTNQHDKDNVHQN